MTANHTDVSFAGSTASDPSEPTFGSYFVSTYPPFSQWSPDEVPHVQRVLLKATPTQNAPFGLYVHVPFCAQRCDYCYYLSHAGKTQDDHREYVAALLEEALMYREMPALSERSLRFVYFGGGTPSMLDNASIRTLLTGLRKRFSWDRVEEATFECAPQTVTESKLRILRDAGITRLSLGVQSFNDEVLKLNGRVHLRKDVERAYERIRRIDFNVVNLDLIVGLPGESDDSVDQSLERVIELVPESITIYQLEIPQNTPLYRVASGGKPSATVPSWHVKRVRLARCFERLEGAGYTVRSAYAAVRDPDRHRFVYQDEQYRGADLLGIGLSSFSYLAGVHFQNIVDFDAYLEAVSRREFPVLRAHALSREERLIREIVLQLKLGRIDAAYFAKKFGVEILSYLKRPFQRLANRGWLAIDAEGALVTREGLIRIDRILKEFYLPEHRHVRYS